MKLKKEEVCGSGDPSTPLCRTIVVGMLICISWAAGFFFHSVLQTEIIYTHFIYIPIVVASMCWGRRGLFVLPVLVAIITSYHLLGIATCPLWHDLIRIAFFIIVALWICSLRQQVVKRQNMLQVSEKKYTMLIEESLTGILVCRENRILFANRKMIDILGYPKGELMHKSIRDLVHPDDLEKIKYMVSSAVQEDGSGSICQCRYLCANGRVLWADVSRNDTIYDGANAVLMNVYDISRRKESEEKRRELSELAKRQEEQLVHNYRLVELGEMAAAISHELNQPLTGIHNYAKNAIYMIDHDINGPKEVKDNLKLISEQVKRASKILNQMKELARRTELHITSVNINDLIMECVDFLHPQMRSSKVRVNLDLGDDLPMIFGDWVRLEQVLLNLFTNARQALEDVYKRNLYIRTAVDVVDDSFICIEISDTGMGFSEEEKEQLFKPFYTTKAPGDGTGLGLSISLRIIREHNGTIEVASVQGEGSSFKVRLPIKRQGENTE